MKRSHLSETQSLLRHWREAVPNDRLAHLVKDAGRALVRALTVRLAEHQVSFGHWSFLRVLWEEDGITQRELSERVGVMEPTTFSAIKAMERLGYVKRQRYDDDQKRVYIHLTEEGRLLKKRLVPFAEEVNRISVENIPVEHIGVTRKVLLKIIENMALAEGASEKPMPSTRAIGNWPEVTKNDSRVARR